MGRLQKLTDKADLYARWCGGCGEEQGLEKGEFKLIRTLQEILGEPISAESDLANHELEQLQSIAAVLHDRILRRI